MNSSARCHEVEDCPGLYIDAFRGSFATKTQNASCSFVLTHYHGDHYNGLPRENKYQGPAQIHCTPVTAALLRNVHEVPAHLVVEHEYGSIWTHKMLDSDEEAKISFHDANHCPGAAIVLIQLPDGTCHLHTGDMRYHEKMKSYSLLQRAVQQRKLGVLYLDTTYGHPKHDLIPQEVAVDTIASHVETVMKDDSRTLVLLSCYSIGKEKVLWEASRRANQLVYVSDRKRKMLQCIQGYQEDESSQILTRCTVDSSQSDIHVIPMGMAGEMWPYFRPNYRACADYAEKLEKTYDKVVAFLPTGWAESTNWNKKNAISRKRLELKQKEGAIEIEIRLVSYSEHSSFPELCAFVEYLRPRQVIPTVFSDENDRRRIESHFRKLVDTSRAKQHFFKSMRRTESETSSNVDPKGINCVENEGTEIEVIDVDSPGPSNGRKRKVGDPSSDQLASLTSMGFDSDSAQRSLEKCGGNLEAALEELLGNRSASSPAMSASKRATPTKGNGSMKTPNIRNFFSPKEK